MPDKALLVVDMLRDFLEPDGALYCGDQAAGVVAPVRDLLAAHRREGSLIIFVADSHAPDDLEFQLFPPHCITGTRGAELLPGFTVNAGERLVRKHRYSALYGTELEDILRRAGVKEVHLAGVCTSICVMETASDLRNRDYQVVIHPQAVADFDPQAHEAALRRMEKILGCRMAG
ncbi:MAG: cysteine hydrolase [Desulfarculus sp.]|nr:cysteine hydrolase [Desulfarculus sp.]